MKYKSFLSFLLVVLVVASLWFISKYKDNYREEVDFEIRFINVPEDLSFEQEAYEINTPVEIQASGFTLIWEKIFGHKLTLDFEDNTFERNDSIFFNPARSFKNIKRSKSIAYQVLDAEDEEVYLEIKRFISKKVSFKHNYKISYSQNFAPVAKPYFKPDSVLITGNDERVMNTSELFLSLEDSIIINDSITVKRIDLKSLFPELKFDPSEIDFIIEAAQMTEGSMEIVVELQHIPKNVTVKLFPEKIRVVYTTQLKDFDNVQASDFNAIVDYKELQGLNAAAIPQMKVLNDKIVSYRIDPKQVQILTIN